MISILIGICRYVFRITVYTPKGREAKKKGKEELKRAYIQVRAVAVYKYLNGKKLIY